MGRVPKPINRLLMALLLVCSMRTTETRFINVRTAKKYDQIIQSGKPTVIKFSADWCGACRMVGDSFKELSRERAHANIDFVEIDVDKIPDVAQREGVRGIPTFLYVADGRTKGKTVGIKDPATFKNQIRTEIRARLKDEDAREYEYEKEETVWGKIKGFFETVFTAIWSMVAFVLGKIKFIFGRG